MSPMPDEEPEKPTDDTATTAEEVQRAAGMPSIAEIDDETA